MTHTHRTTLFVLALTLATLACSGPRPINIEQPQEPTAVQDTVKQDTVKQDTIATVARDTLSKEEYNALMAALKPKLNTKQRQRKKANAPTRKGYDYNLLSFEGYVSFPIGDIFPDYITGLYGNVESITETAYTIKEENDIYFKQKEKELLYELNVRGDFTKITYSEPGKENVVSLLCKYDSNGNMTYCKNGNRETLKIYDSKGNLIEDIYKGDDSEICTKYRRDDEGRTIAIINLRNKVIQEETYFQYDRNGKLIKELCYNDQDSLVGYKEYDSQGRVVSEIAGNYQFGFGIVKYKYKRKGLHTTKFQYVPERGRWLPVEKYNKQGKCIESRFYWPHDGSLYALTTLRYDKRGNITYRGGTQLYYDNFDAELGDPGDLWSVCKYTYDSYNRVIKSESYDNSQMGVGATIKYDAKGNLILLYEYPPLYNDGSKLVGVAFKYDSLGNVVQKIKYNSEKKPTSVTDYKIVYRK